MVHTLLVALGGGLGAALRHLTNLAALRLLGPNFPFGTLAVNVIGSFLMGVLVEVVARRFGASAELRLFLATGVLGGYTTFSAFSLDTIVLWERGAPGVAVAYVGLSVLLSLAAIIGGLWLARTVF
ncbi:fluoride efflux transporter CrcB [Rhizobium sp. EC-SD404]|uniref:fluoride efflux transporter CrcB n=1 Tax=Rhizobium sp. EC-SD404 TaxID=2038389 RepID=UPI001254D65B|nr:fluoride efflux transporter CrcB [Rhizobium sp. EC-SD404]VVT22406.1 putative fluoride ion transporter CrcB [Rhizobium sp. EC-SD404]